MDIIQCLELLQLRNHCLFIDIEDVLLGDEFLIRFFAQSPFLGHIFILPRVSFLVELHLRLVELHSFVRFGVIVLALWHTSLLL